MWDVSGREEPDLGGKEGLPTWLNNSFTDVYGTLQRAGALLGHRDDR